MNTLAGNSRMAKMCFQGVFFQLFTLACLIYVQRCRTWATVFPSRALRRRVQSYPKVSATFTSNSHMQRLSNCRLSFLLPKHPQRFLYKPRTQVKVIIYASVCSPPRAKSIVYNKDKIGSDMVPVINFAVPSTPL